jgi:hypothetical protein
MKVIPKFMTNVEVKFSIPGCEYGFKCRGYKIGGFEVRVYQSDAFRAEIAFMVGGDERFRMPAIYTNLLNFPEELLADLYHMCRCRREMDRLGPDGLGFDDVRNGFLYFEKEFGNRYRQWVENASC